MFPRRVIDPKTVIPWELGVLNIDGNRTVGGIESVLRNIKNIGVRDGGRGGRGDGRGISNRWGRSGRIGPGDRGGAGRGSGGCHGRAIGRGGTSSPGWG